MEKYFSIDIDVSPDLDEKLLKENHTKLESAWQKREDQLKDLWDLRFNKGAMLEYYKIDQYQKKILDM